MIVFTTFTFEAAHWLPKVPLEHKCHRLHGHSYHVEVQVSGPVDATGFVLDYADIRAAFEPLRMTLDHHCLNEINGLENPTCEHIARWLWTRMAVMLPLHELRVRETEHSGCIYRGENQ